MASQAAGVAMDDETGTALRASGLPAAGRAHQRGRIAATVDEHERLLATLEPQRDGVVKAAADAFGRRRIAMRREHDRRRSRGSNGARRENEPLVAAPPRLMQRLDRRRRRAENARAAA